MPQAWWIGRYRSIPRSTVPTSAQLTFPAPQGEPSNYMNLFDEPADHAIGRSRRGLSTKIHALVDGNGRPLVLLVAPGQGGDAPMFPHLMSHLTINRAGPGRPRTRPDRVRGDRPIHHGRSGPTSGPGASRPSSRNRPIRSDIVNDEAPPEAGHRPSTRRTTRAAMSSNGTSTPSSNGAVWLPDTTDSHSPTEADPSCELSPSG